MSFQRAMFFGLVMRDQHLERALREALKTQSFIELKPEYFTDTTVCLYDSPEEAPAVGQCLLLAPTLHQGEGVDLQLPLRFSMLISLMKHLYLNALKAVTWHFPTGEIFSPLDQRVTYEGGEIALTEKETLLLETLCDNATGRSRKVLLHDVWKYASSVESHTIESHLYRLRKKLLAVSFCVDQVNGDYALSSSPRKEILPPL